MLLLLLLLPLVHQGCTGVPNDFYFTTGAFSFPSHPITVLSTTSQLEISISDPCNMTTVTHQTDGVYRRRLYF